MSVDICKNKKNKPRNTGANEQCLEGILDLPCVSKDGFAFASVADFKDEAKWLEAIAAKNLVPLYQAYEVTPQNTEATTYETGNFSYETNPPVKKIAFESYLGHCSHRALASYEKSEYTRLFEFTSDGSVWGVDAGEGKVKGQKLSNLAVGIRVPATKDKPAYTPVVLTYKDYNEFQENPVGVIPNFDAVDIPGIFDVTIEQVGAATATSIKFKVLAGCESSEVTTLVAANVVVKDASGAVETVSFVPYDEEGGFYEVTGTVFATGFTVSLDGVITQTDIMYEAVEPLTVNVA